MVRQWTRRIGYAAGAAAAAATLVGTGSAQAAPATPAYFSYGGFQCEITPDGSVGCDLATPRQMYIEVLNTTVAVPFAVREVLIDVPWAPAHPGLGIGTPHTLPGGNPDIATVGHPTGSGATSGSEVTLGGASCATGFHGSFTCTAKGHQFNYYEAINAS